MLCPILHSASFTFCRVLSGYAAASLAVTVNAVSGVSAEGDALVADGPYGMWSLDTEQVTKGGMCSAVVRQHSSARGSSIPAAG